MRKELKKALISQSNRDCVVFDVMNLAKMFNIKNGRARNWKALNNRDAR